MWAELRGALAHGCGRAPFTTAFTDAGTTFVLESERPEVLADVDRYYPPPRVGRGRSRITVREVVRPGLVDRVAAYTACHAPSAWRERFNNADRYGAYRDRDLELHVPETAGDHCVARRGRTVWIVLRHERPSLAMRLARDVLLRVRENQGAVLFHGGGVCGPDGAILLVGPSAAGKTTAVCAFVSALRWDYVANDRVFVRDAPSGFAVGAFPLSIRLGRGTLRGLPDTWRAMRLARPQPAAFTAAGGPDVDDGVDDGAAFGEKDKLELLPSEFLAFLGAGFRAEAPLRAIVIPNIRLGARGVAVDAVAPDDARAVLGGQLQTPWDMTWKQDWVWRLRRPEAAVRRRAEALVGRLVAQVPAFRLTFGGDLAAHAAAVRDALLARSAPA